MCEILAGVLTGGGHRGRGETRQQPGHQRHAVALPRPGDVRLRRHRRTRDGIRRLREVLSHRRRYCRKC
jgi:hypothetical protein